MKMAQAPADAKPLLDQIEAGRADPRMQGRSADVSQDLRQFDFDRSHAAAESYRRQVFAEVQKDNPILAGSYEDVEKDITYRKQGMLQRAVNATLQRDAGRAGVKVDTLPKYRPD